MCCRNWCWNAVPAFRKKIRSKKVTAITREVAGEHGENSGIAVSRAKTFIIENTEVCPGIPLDPVELGKRYSRLRRSCNRKLPAASRSGRDRRDDQIDRDLAIAHR